jgi:hypothetical protein
MAVALTKFQPFVENLAQKGIDLSGAQITVGLTNAANPPLVADGVIADQTQVAYTFCSTRVCTVSAHAQSGGTFTWKITDLVLTATGGAVGPFQYIFLYDDGSTGDMLIGFYNYGSEITLADGETLTINFDDTNGVLTIA